MTGLPEGVARVRLDRVGLAELFPRGQGAFGCDSEDREELLRIALRRAGVEARQAVAIGDTPVDVLTANAVGVHSIVFASGDAEWLDDADAFVASRSELPSVVGSL